MATKIYEIDLFKFCLRHMCDCTQMTVYLHFEIIETLFPSPIVTI